MFLALRDLRRMWRRFLLVGAVVGLVATLGTVLAGLADGLVRDGISGLRSLPVTDFAFAPHSDAVFSRSTLDDRALGPWQDAPGVDATPIGVSFVNAAAERGGPSLDIALFGVEPDGFLAPRGAGTRPGEPLAGLLLSDELREDGVKVGDRYRIGGSGVTLPVLGFTSAGSYGHAPIAYTALREWQAIAYGNDPRGRFSAVALRVPGDTDAAAIARTSDTELVTKRGAYDGSPGYTAETATMTLIRGFLVVISALIVGAFFTVLTVQRTRQIGLLKAMGASTSYVVRDGVAQMTIVVALATVAGAALGTAIVAALAGGPVPVALDAGSIVASAALLVVTGIAGSLVAMRRIARIPPAIALGVEP
jgi:putative ABC transport system permease protein